MTGRAAGFCARNGEAGFTTAPGPFGWNRFGARGFGRGAARGRGAGFGYGLGYGRGFGFAYGADAQAPPPPAPEQQREAIGTEIEALEQRIDYLKRELDAIDSRQGTTDK